MIRKAISEDIDTILAITKACTRHLIDQEIFQWNEHYPNQKTFENDLKREELFVYELNDKVRACIVITVLKDLEYIPVKWLTKDSNLYIQRLAVHPKFQGKGVAQKLMSFAENIAKIKGFLSVEQIKRDLEQDKSIERIKYYYELSPLGKEKIFSAAHINTNNIKYLYKDSKVIIILSIFIGTIIGIIYILIPTKNLSNRRNRNK